MYDAPWYLMQAFVHSASVGPMCMRPWSAVAHSLSVITPVLGLRAIETDRDHLYVALRASPAGLGRALGARRHEVVLATKFGMQVDAERRILVSGEVLELGRGSLNL